MTIQEKHTTTFTEKFGKETPAYKITYYGNGNFAIEDNTKENKVVAGQLEPHNPYHQSFYTFLNLQDAEILAKEFAAQYSDKFKD